MSEPINHKARAHGEILRPSNSDIWLACPGSAVASKAYPNVDTAYTREGTLAHEVAEIVARRSIPQLCPDIDTMEYPEGYTVEMVEHAKGYADYIMEQITRPDAVVMLEQRVDISPWVPGSFGTCDCIIIQGDTMTVIDYKYGAGVKVDANCNTQLMLYALGALNDYGIAYDVETVNMAIYQPRMDNVSTFREKAATILHWADTVVKKIAEKAAVGKGGYHPGAHCKFCPHAGRCRALTKVCTEFVETHSGRVSVPVLAPHEVAEVLRMEPLVTLWLKRVKTQALADLMDGKEVPGYKVVEGKQGNRKWTDELAVAEKLQAEGYQLNDITEAKLLSPAGMDKALGKKRVAELLDGMIDRAPGAPTVVTADDKRPAYDRVAEAVKDFE